MKINIKHIAKLADLPIKDDEEKMLEEQLEATVEHIESLNDIPTDHITSTNEVTGLENVMREDEVRPSLTQEQALQNAKKTYNGFFVVPVIIEEAIEA